MAVKKKPKPKVRAGTELILMIGLLFLVFTARSVFVGPPAVDPSHVFNTDRALERLERILGDESPHPVDSDANDAVRERLLTEITDIGYEPIVRDAFHCNSKYRGVRCARVQNVMFWIGEPAENAVMIASHYDSVPAGPGAADDGSGVAASLEIAAILKGRALPRPVLVLITDGEEMGLLGASQFVSEDPFAKMVSAVVSMEARGVRGPVAMFETSLPNGRDIAGLSPNSLPGKLKNPISSSFAVDIYRAMPNGTDVTEYLTLGMDAANYAIGQGAHFYHTPRDNLDMLDKRSFFHMGASALESVEGFVNQKPGEPEKQWIYGDYMGAFMLAMPQAWSFPLILLGGLAAGFVFWFARGAPALRTGFYPAVALALGIGLAVIITALIGNIRSEAHFGAANPWALRGAQNAAALTGAALALAVMIRPGAKTRLLMSGWMWMALIALIATMRFPGAAILFVPALLVMTIAILLSAFGRAAWSRAVALFASFVFAVTILPTTAFAESSLFIENAAALTLFLILLFVTLAPIALEDTDFSGWRRWRPAAICAAAMAAFSVLALNVPAYSTDAPRSLSVVHSAEAGTDTAYWSVWGNDPLPPAMTDAVSFSRGDAPGLIRERWIAAAPPVTAEPVSTRITAYKSLLGEPMMAVDINAPDADRVQGGWAGDTGAIRTLTIGDQIIELTPDMTPDFTCYGRALPQSQCRDYRAEL